MTIAPLRTALFVPLWLVALTACNEGDASAGSPTGFPSELNGELGRGEFRYACLDDSDASCNGMGFPAAIAQGARFDLRYEPGSPLRLGGLSVESGSAMTQELGDVYEVRDSGRFVMLAVHRGEVVDLVHVLSKPLDELAIEDAEGFVLSDVELEQGESLDVAALPLDDEGRLLAGSLQYDWSIQGPSAASFRSPGLDPRRVTITAEWPGQTDLVVSVGEATQTLSITVGSARGADTDPDADTGFDTDTDTDTDADTDTEGL